MKGKLSDKARLEHIIDAITYIEQFVKDVDEDKFKESDLIFFACVKQFEIIGEASARLTNELQINNDQIPWDKIIGFRNILVHDYFGVDYTAVWDVIKNNLPELKIQINKILDNLKEQIN